MNADMFVFDPGKRAAMQRTCEMIEAAKIKALSEGSALHAAMLMKLMTVEGGREILWAMTNAAQRRDIQAIASRYVDPTKAKP